MGKRRRKRTVGKCVYCNTAEGITVDHIPPRSLFAKDNRNDLVRVPSCRQCNGGDSKDDEYFRLAIAMRYDAIPNPDAEQALASVMRSLSRPEQRGLLGALRSNVALAPVYKSGLFLGHSLAYNVDLARLARVAERIVKGLFWHHTNRPLASGYGTRVLSVDGLAQGDINALVGLKNLVEAVLKGDGLQSIGGSAFEYWFSRVASEPDATVWLIRIYQRAYFVGFTLREIDLERVSRYGALGTSTHANVRYS